MVVMLTVPVTADWLVGLPIQPPLIVVSGLAITVTSAELPECAVGCCQA